MGFFEVRIVLFFSIVDLIIILLILQLFYMIMNRIVLAGFFGRLLL